MDTIVIGARSHFKMGSPRAYGETGQLKAEVSRLKADLKRANEERDILKKAATYFAKLSG